ncbi:MAG TPA: chromosome segregation protein SMC [Acidimicrobiales bacterium]|nr:chromosome segregation protein SMC [Acidimicrobiales bacterium]
MFLKSLTMKGFKSFADPTVLEFEPGITVVVGPNGSGKSNVVDAVTWVLGAQGPRSLRSQKMEDVIFAGTSTRPALGRAEVLLTIDNSSGRLPIDMSEVTISRTLFRSGDSEYAINGAACRLLDIQDLLSDSGVGRQQHMIVGQGQLDTVLNARPEDRRAIIEEAAGVLKHRRRRERAERRLASTQENLERLGDLVREVKRQIRPLERQAAAARSHATLADDLLAVRRYLAAEELAALAARRVTASASLADLEAETGSLEGRLAELDRAAASTAAELSSRREEDLASALGRVQGLVERTRGTAGVVRERQRALAAALDAAADTDVVSSLEADAARLAAELEACEEDAGRLGPEQVALAFAEEELVADERAHAERVGAGVDPAATARELSAARDRLEERRHAVEHARSVVASLDEQIAGVEARVAALVTAAESRRRRREELDRRGADLDEASSGARRADHEARRRADEAEVAAGAAHRAQHRASARAEALARALRDLEGAGGREVLAGADGVVGVLIDLVEIDPGWEAAFEAAAGAMISAVVVDGPEPARRAMGRLVSHRSAGSILAAGRAGRTGRPAAGPRPPGVEPLGSHVRPVPGAPVAVASILGALCEDAVRVGSWEEAVELSLDRPDLVVLTAEGDRFAPSGWRVRSTDHVVTPRAVEEAEHQAQQAAAAARVADDQLAAARRDLEAARVRAQAAERDVDRHGAVVAALDVEGDRDAQEIARLTDQLDVWGARRLATATGSLDDEQAMEGAAAEVGRLQHQLDRVEEVAAQAAQALAVLEARRAAVATQRHELEVRVAGIDERRRVLTERRREVERRLTGHAEERAEAAARRQRLEAEGQALERLDRLVVDERRRLEEVLASLRRDYRDQVEAVRAGGERLEAIRAERAGCEQRLGQVRERARALDLEVAEVSLRTDTLLESVERDLGTDPAGLAGTERPELPEGVSAAEQASVLADQLAALGPVNPLALEELAVLEERHRDLDQQVGDIRSARRELQEVIRTLDEEIAQSFTAAVADVNEHFSSLVATLFPGGTGRLVLTEPGDLLNTGVEVEVRPMGRNVRRVSLLSGGERSLAALAFLFAVFRSRPSPFYLMDEVEAALDDVNLHRFLGLLHEFREEAQLIVVSHQKRTMETADALYGVTMAPGGSSQVLSQRVRREPEAAAS